MILGTGLSKSYNYMITITVSLFSIFNWSKNMYKIENIIFGNIYPQ